MAGLKFRLFTGRLVATLWRWRSGLQVNCLLTRYPLVWVQPNWKDCIHLARLQDHGFQVSAVGLKMSSNTSLSQPNHPSHTHSINRATNFDGLLDQVRVLAEKDLLEF